jgi:predicted DNA-binding transcriptional regulator YafY
MAENTVSNGGEISHRISDGRSNRSPIRREADHFSEQETVHAVCIYFLPEAANALTKQIWFEGQRLVTHENQLLELSFEVTSLEGLTRWILGWGPVALVAKPQILRASVLSAAQAVLDKHAD